MLQRAETAWGPAEGVPGRSQWAQRKIGVKPSRNEGLYINDFVKKYEKRECGSCGGSTSSGQGLLRETLEGEKEIPRRSLIFSYDFYRIEIDVPKNRGQIVDIARLFRSHRSVTEGVKNSLLKSGEIEGKATMRAFLRRARRGQDPSGGWRTVISRGGEKLNQKGDKQVISQGVWMRKVIGNMNKRTKGQRMRWGL